MKKIFYYIILSAICILPYSCSLDEESRTEIDKTRFMQNAQEAETVLLGVYQSLVSDAMYGMNLSFLFNLATDCEQVEGTTTENFRIVPTNAFNSSQAEIQQTWAALYKAIYNANDFMEILEQRMKTFNETDKQLAYIYLAEAKVIRGMCYFELVRRYGNVPLMATTAMSEQAPGTFVRTDQYQIPHVERCRVRTAHQSICHLGGIPRKRHFQMGRSRQDSQDTG